MGGGEQLVIAGYGDIGRRVAALALARGQRVAALTRSPEATAFAERQGVEIIPGDLDRSDGPVVGLPTAGATVLYAAPPPGGGDSDPRVRVFCGSIEPGAEPRRVIYLSTSGVYGDCAGALVDETTPARGTTARARRRLDAESVLKNWGDHRGVAITILRVSAIYGPGRFPFDRLLGHHPVLAEAESPLSNRIHADDLARICLAAANWTASGDLINVSDGEALTMTAYFDAVAAAFGLPRPPRVSRRAAAAVMSPLMLSYFSESRRLENRRLRQRLGTPLLYPDLAHGLAAAVAAGVTPVQPLGRTALPTLDTVAEPHEKTTGF